MQTDLEILRVKICDIFCYKSDSLILNNGFTHFTILLIYEYFKQLNKIVEKATRLPFQRWI